MNLLGVSFEVAAGSLLDGWPRSTAVLRFEAVTRRFGATRALDEVAFELQRGTLTVLTGPNGAGKSTLLRLAATLDAPSAGRVLVDGSDAAQEGPRARGRIAWLGQDPGLYDDLTVRENLAFVARFHGSSREVERAARAFGIAPRLDDRARRLSRGQRQRAALARALVGGPLMLLDEPTASLDDEGASAAVDALLAARGERTLLVASHDARLVTRADRVLRLDAGRLAA